MAGDDRQDDQQPEQMFRITKSSTANLGPRLGQLKIRNRKIVNTPHYLALTSRGVVPHLSQDNLARETSISGAYAALEDCNWEVIERDQPPIYQYKPPNGISPLRRFTALPDDMLLVLGARRTPPVIAPVANPNTDTYIAVCTSVGFRSLEVKSFVHGAEDLDPDIIVAIGDIPYQRALGSKRVERATDRMIQWMSAIVAYRTALYGEKHVNRLFAPLIPVSVANQQFYIDHLSQEVRGNIDGLAIYNLDSLPGLPKQMQTLPRLGFTAPATPHHVLKHVDAGLDIVTVPFVNAASDAGIALDFRFPVDKDVEDGSTTASTTLAMGIDMWSAVHSTDVSPLVRGCSCYACRTHHRAYIRHLLNAKEMLAWALLQMHNHHVLDQFFAGVRESIGKDTFVKDVQDFERLYESDMPGITGQGPRLRGYQHKSEGPGEPKKNKPPFQTLNDDAEKLAESTPLASSMVAEDMEKLGLGEAER